MTSDVQFLEVAGIDQAEGKNVQYDLMKLYQGLHDMHIAEIVSQPNWK